MKIYNAIMSSVLLLFVITAAAFGQIVKPVNDPDFNAKIARPAYTKNYPKVLFDEAHFNANVAVERYKAFADLIANDGYQITINEEKFTAKTLEGYAVLIVADAAGAKGIERFDAPAFTVEESSAIRDWVHSGGSLLLIAGATPYGKAAENLARALGVEMSNGRTNDKSNRDPEAPLSSILYTRENKLLADHFITQGRDSTEQLNRVLAYTGQSLKGPENSVAFLKLADTAVESPGISAADIKAAMSEPAKTPESVSAERSAPEKALPQKGLPPGAISIHSKNEVSAAGRAQGVAFTFGKGRVVVLGESDVLAAKLLRGQIARLKGKDSLPIGMNAPGNDNRQLALNIMHWLSGLLPANDAAPRIAAPTAVRASNISPAVTTINAKTNETIEAAKKEAPATPQPERKKMAAPAFSVTSLEGKQYDLASLRGKVIVLNFWFLGCPPCIAEVPELNKLVAEFKDKNVVFLALALDDEKALRSFLKEKEFKYQVVPNASDIIMGKYEVSIFPTHIILDAEGNIVSELIGNKRLDDLRVALRRAVAGQATKTVAP